MNDETPHALSEPPKKCGAKTRSGTPCERSPCPGRTRCRLHGGASPRGCTHPRFKHGAHSVCLLSGFEEQARRRREKKVRTWQWRVGRMWRAYEDACAAVEAYNARPGRRGRPRKLPEAGEFCQRWLRLDLAREAAGLGVSRGGRPKKNC